MKITISRKIAFGFWISITAIVIISIFAYLGSGRIYREALQTEQVRDIRRVLLNAALAHHEWLGRLSISLVDQTVKRADVQVDPQQCDFGKWYYSEKRKEAESIAPYVKELLAKLESPHDRLHKSAIEINQMLEKGDRQTAASLYLQSIVPASNEIYKLLDTAIDIVTENIGDEDLVQTTRLNQIAIATTGIVLSSAVIVIAFFLLRNITSVFKETSTILSSTSTEISATVTQHERTANQQAAMVNETTVTVDELGASARQSSERAASAATLAQKASTMTEEGAKAVRQAIEAMQGLRDKIAVVAEQILRLGDQTNQIGGIAALVSDIAGQTRMLALNAAVEAARAGEQGKGFAVVASEVRKLADQSKKSAEQANSLITEIQKATNSTIMKTEEGTKAVEEITGLARNVGELFSSLSTAAGSVYENAQQVLLNTKQQTAAISQVIEAMGAINIGAQETAAGISQTKIGLEKLNETASGLKKMV